MPVSLWYWALAYYGRLKNRSGILKMHPRRQRKLLWIIVVLLGSAAIVGLVLFSLRQNINLYLIPSQLATTPLKPQQLIRVGGLVLKGSVQHQPHGLNTRFVLTDGKKNVLVFYEGILPSLFREGQGIIAEGRLNAAGTFMATEVLAKHDEEYRPPNIEALSENSKS